MKKNPSWAFLSAPSFVALQRSSSRSDLCSVNVNPACPRLIQMFYSVISHKDASRNQRYSSISHSHKHESSSSSPPRPCPPPPLGSVPPSGNQCSFYLLIHTPRIDLCRPGHPACRQQLNTAFLPSLEHRWPTRTQERGLGVPGL